MSKLSAITFVREMSPNAGEQGTRPFDRVFPFRTTASEEDVLQPGWLAPQELTNAQVGETLIIYGTDYVLHARVTAKNGNQVILTRIGSEKGPDPLIVSVATIAPGEVHTSVTHGLGYVPRPARFLLHLLSVMLLLRFRTSRMKRLKLMFCVPRNLK